MAVLESYIKDFQVLKLEIFEFVFGNFSPSVMIQFIITILQLLLIWSIFNAIVCFFFPSNLWVG